MAKLSYWFQLGLVLAASSAAASDIVSDRPYGTEKTYDLTTQQIHGGETYDFSGILSSVVFDGDDVWFGNPITAFGFGSWVKGQRQGNKILVESGQMIHHQDAGDGCPELDVSVVSGSWLGDMPWPDGEEYAEFLVSGDGTIVLPEGKMLLATDWKTQARMTPAARLI